MFVDDDPSILFSIKTVFEFYHNDFVIITADSYQDCIDKLDNLPLPDIIILDIMMPIINGFELFKKIKENPDWSHIPIAFLTASVDKLIEEKGRNLGIEYFEKPIEHEDLINRIKKII